MRDAAWLHGGRARAWCRTLAVISLIAAVGWVALSHGGVDRAGRPLGTDFVSFWSASRLALDGQAAAAYDMPAHAAAQRAALPGAGDDYYAFFYPPVFLLLCLPLALLPYVPALAAWLAAGFAAYLVCIRAILPQHWAVLPAAAFPAVLVNAGHGQNGYLSAACMGAGVILLERRPFLAGLCWGALIYKPHLMLAAPVAVLFARRWAVLAGAAVSAAGLTALSWAVLGSSAWQAFRRATPLAQATLEQGLVEPWKMQSVFAAARLWGASLGSAYALHAATLVAACAVLAWSASRRPGGQAEGVLLVSATLLCSPFMLDYDLACLAIPLAWVAADAQRTGWLPWEKLVLLAGYVLPLASRVLAMGGVPVAPLVLALVLWVVARRVRREPDFAAA